METPVALTFGPGSGEGIAHEDWRAMIDYKTQLANCGPGRLNRCPNSRHYHGKGSTRVRPRPYGWSSFRVYEGAFCRASMTLRSVNYNSAFDLRRLVSCTDVIAGRTAHRGRRSQDLCR
jgi:hypothetical protein